MAEVVKLMGGAGALGSHGVEYWTGDANADAKIRLVNEIGEKIKPVWNTMALVPGRRTDEVMCVNLVR